MTALLLMRQDRSGLLGDDAGNDEMHCDSLHLA
jgi:hypothetical protein